MEGGCSSRRAGAAADSPSDLEGGGGGQRPGWIRPGGEDRLGGVVTTSGRGDQRRSCAGAQVGFEVAQGELGDFVEGGDESPAPWVPLGLLQLGDDTAQVGVA